jgi:PPOX class probable F420-dependent enzyme
VDESTRKFLSGQRLAHLATADARARPHVVPVCFVLMGDTIYIAIDEKPKQSDFWRLRRLKNIAENPRVAIIADVYDDSDWSRLGFVLVHASARVVPPDPDPASEHASAVRELRLKYAQYSSMALDERPVIAADIHSASSWGRLEG